MSGSSYSLTTFSPSGTLPQIEYALQAVSDGKISVGIKATNGVVIATERKIPSVLVDETTMQKIQLITENIGVTYSGMGPDFRLLYRRARKEAQRYWLELKDNVPVSQLVRETASVVQEFTQSGGVRPFGVSLLVAGYDDDGPQLYQVDPSGSYWAWKASAIGKKATDAKGLLEKRYNPEMELEDAIHTAILILKEAFEGGVDENNIQVGVVGKDRKFRILTPSELKDYVNEVE